MMKTKEQQIVDPIRKYVVYLCNGKSHWYMMETFSHQCKCIQGRWYWLLGHLPPCETVHAHSVIMVRTVAI